MYSGPSGKDYQQRTTRQGQEFFIAKMSEPPRSRIVTTIPPSTGSPGTPTGYPWTISESLLCFRLGFSSGFQHIAGQSPTRPQAGHQAVRLGHTVTNPSKYSAAGVLTMVSVLGTASPTVLHRGHISVASRLAGLKSSVNKRHPLSAVQRAPSGHPSAAPVGGSQVVPSEPTYHPSEK